MKTRQHLIIDASAEGQPVIHEYQDYFWYSHDNIPIPDGYHIDHIENSLEVVKIFVEEDSKL